MRRDVTTMICLLAAFGASPPISGAAQSFSFLFGGPRHRVHPTRASNPVDVPMPVPRPHFVTDVPTPATKDIPGTKDLRETPQSQAGSPLSAPKSQPPPVSMSSGSGAPLPPPKPTDLSEPPESENTKTEPPKATASTPPGVASVPAPSAKPNADVAQKPSVSPVGASQAFTPRAPADDPACPGLLVARHLSAERVAIGPQPDARCTVVEPVKLTNLTLVDGTVVEFPDHPTIACITADAFSLYVRDLLVPLARGTFGSPVVTVWTGPGLECRSRDHIFGAKLSAHGQGLAIDIAQIKLADGRMIAVGEPKTDTDTGFETAARAAACGYFHTVLGPGSDSYHRTHWHFDLEVRGAGGDAKYCK